MSLELSKMKSGKAKAPRIEEGTLPARIVSIVDLGIQPMTDWQTGEEVAPKPRVLFTWELPTETLTFVDEDGNEEEKPRWISKEYTASSFERSNLMKLMVALGKGDADSLNCLIDTPCLLTIGSTVNGNAKIVAVVRPPKAMPVDELVGATGFFDFDEPEEELFLQQPDWIKEKIKDAENYTGFADSWVKADA